MESLPNRIELLPNEVIEKILCELSFCDIKCFTKAFDTNERIKNLMENDGFIQRNLFKKWNVLYKFNETLIGDMKIKYANVYRKDCALIVNVNDDVYHLQNETIVKLDSLSKKGIYKFSIESNYGICIFAINKNGEIFAFGNNKFKQIMNSDENYIENPQKIPFNGNVIEIACGRCHTMALTDENKVFTWGYNMFGAIGDGTKNAMIQPFHVKIEENANVKSIICGDYYSMVLYDNGTFYVWGLNEWSHLGSDAIQYKSICQLIPLKVYENTKQIVRGNGHTLRLTYDGILYSMGGNICGQLGNGNTKSGNVPQRIGMKFKKIGAFKCASMGIGQNGECYVWGRINEENIIIPKKVKFDSFKEIFETFWSVTNGTINTENSCFCSLCMNNMNRIKKE